MATPFSNPVVGGMTGSFVAIVVAATGYCAFTSGTFLKPDAVSQMRSTCEATLTQNASAASTLKGLPPVQACDCFVNRFYPTFSEPTRSYVLDLYARVEANAPGWGSSRAAYDADFADRLKAAFQIDQFSHMGNAIQFMSELNSLGSKDFGPQCNLLK